MAFEMPPKHPLDAGATPARSLRINVDNLHLTLAPLTLAFNGRYRRLPATPRIIHQQPSKQETPH